MNPRTRDPLGTALTHVEAATLNTVVHVGAGNGRSIATFRTRPVRRLVLVEGDSQLLPALRAAARGLDGVDVQGHAIGADGGDGSWHRYNVSRLNGLLGPGDLQDVYPGLREQASEVVSVRTLADLLSRVAAPSGARPANVLVLDFPGPLCSQLAEVPEPVFDAYGWVFVRAPQRALLAGADTAGAAREWLMERHFADAWSDTTSDPLWASHLLRLDGAGRQIASLRARLRERDAQIAGLEAAQAELRQKRQALAQSIATLEADLKASAERAKDAEQLAQVAKQRNEQITRLRKELEEARQSALVTARLHLRRDADLRELQARFDALSHAHAAQQQLLAQLEVHVGEAARQVQGLGGATAAS